MRKILITGGAGFIGSALTKELKRQDYKTTIFDNLSLGKPEAEIPKHELFVGDVRSQKELGECVEKFKPDIVIHLAALHYIPYCEANKRETLDVNVVGTQNVISAIEEITPKTRLIFSSSAAVYKDMPGVRVETDQLVPLDIYGISKLFAENLINQSKIDYCILRLFNVFGPGDRNPHVVPMIVNQAKKDHKIKLGNIENARDFVYVEDVARGVSAVIDNWHAREVYNLGTGKSTTVKELAQIINEEIFNNSLSFESCQFLKRKKDRRDLVANIDKLKSHTGWTSRVELVEGLKNSLK